MMIIAGNVVVIALRFGPLTQGFVRVAQDDAGMCLMMIIAGNVGVIVSRFGFIDTRLGQGWHTQDGAAMCNMMIIAGNGGVIVCWLEALFHRYKAWSRVVQRRCRNV